jgi:hypothetical protein
MDEELSTLHKTDTWNLVPLPLGKNVDGCMDYEEIFALVVKMITIRTFIVVALVCR